MYKRHNPDGRVQMNLEPKEYEALQQIMFCYLNYTPEELKKKNFNKLAKDIYN